MGELGATPRPFSTEKLKGLARDTLGKLFSGVVLTPAQDAKAFDQVHQVVCGAFADGYTAGLQDRKLPDRDRITIGVLAITVLFCLGLITFMARLPLAPTKLATPAVVVVTATQAPVVIAPDWEWNYITEPQAAKAKDYVAVDFKQKSGDGKDWVYSNSAQYGDLLLLRSVSIDNPTKLKIFAYRWTGTDWVFEQAQCLPETCR